MTKKNNNMVWRLIRKWYSGKSLSKFRLFSVKFWWKISEIWILQNLSESFKMWWKLNFFIFQDCSQMFLFLENLNLQMQITSTLSTSQQYCPRSSAYHSTFLPHIFQEFLHFYTNLPSFLLWNGISFKIFPWFPRFTSFRVSIQAWNILCFSFQTLSHHFHSNALEWDRIQMIP